MSASWLPSMTPAPALPLIVEWEIVQYEPESWLTTPSCWSPPQVPKFLIVRYSIRTCVAAPSKAELFWCCPSRIAPGAPM